MPFRLAGLPTLVAGGIAMLLATSWPMLAAENLDSRTLSPLYERFAPRDDGQPDTEEVPDFQKHVSPLLGRLGCNGRACHGSFQGQGGFRLSLFGYDFDADHKALLEDGAARVDLSDQLESLILTKPVDADMHDGGKRYEHGGWEYWVLRRWVEEGAAYSAKQVQKLERLEVTPGELSFSEKGQTRQLKAIAHWQDGASEDVTCLCRFQSNDSAIASIDESGRVTCGEPGDTHVVVSYDSAVVPILALRPMSDRVGASYPNVVATTEIDRRVLEKLKKLGVVPSEICTDEEFLRRASLDVTATLPTPQSILEFVADPSPDKRQRKIEELLDSPGYAAQWTTFLCDITGNNEDQLRNFLPQRVQPAGQWYQWIYQRVADNVPYDQIVEGIVTATSRLPDESYRDYCEAMSEICQDQSGKKFAERPGLVHYWARNNFRSAEERAIGFAYSFLGVRIQCAQCHKHPFDQWSKDDFDNFEKLFGRVAANQNTLSPDAKREFTQMVAELDVNSKLKGNQLRRQLGELLRQGKTVPFPELTIRVPNTKRKKNKKSDQANPVFPKAKLLGGDWIELSDADVRGNLMAWLRSPQNPYFAKAIVNRVWAQYFGVGIVDPPDDLNLANAPSNARLLDYLTDGFIDSGYDLKWLHREILGSDTYQRSWIPNESNALDKHNFSHSQLRRLPAESTYDAVRMALASDDYAQGARELELPRAISRPGSSARAPGRDDTSYALAVFGRSIRETNCDCDRSSEPSLLQTVFLLNDSAVQNWLSDPKSSWVSAVADKYQWEKPSSNPSDKARRAQLEQVIKKFVDQKEATEKRMEEAKAKGQTKLVQQMQKRRADLMKRARSTAKKNGLEKRFEALLDGGASESASEDRMTQEQALWIAENAYLRTLSRKPNSEELAVAIDFLRSEEKPTAAVEGLLWSLLNTKEFVLNH